MTMESDLLQGQGGHGDGSTRELHSHRSSFRMTQLPSSMANATLSMRVKALKNSLTMRHIGYMSNVILMVALCLGMYSRWMLSQQFIILIIAIMGLFIFAISCALMYYFSQEALGMSLSRLWMGCLLGVVAFTEEVTDNYATLEEVMNILLMTSITTRSFWSVLERILKLPRKQLLFDPYEALEMIGMAAATFMCNKQSVSLSLLVIAFALTLVAIRLKSYLAVLNLIVMIIIASLIYFPRLVETPVNSFALGCFVTRLSFEPVVDIYLGGMTTMERWQPLLRLPSFIRRLGIFTIFVMEATFFTFLAKQMPNHKEWFIVVPIFAAFSIVWWSYHIVFIITLWQLMSKINDCNLTYNSLLEENRNMSQIMAAKGVRHFSLIAQRLTLVTLITTVLLQLIDWTTMTGLSVSMFFIVIPIEASVMSLLWQMGRILGGTCTGYALVAPTFTRQSDSPVLPASVLHEVGTRATRVLTTIQQFFSSHLVEVYGCDYSSSGLTAESVQTKLTAFFQRHTSDGPRFDTYLVYYCGHVHSNGEWALLGGNSSLKLETIIEWWREIAADSGSRLILVLDTDNSHHWLRGVRQLQHDIVAIQTCQVRQSRDPEGNHTTIGDFTEEWTTFNGNRAAEIKWMQPNYPIRAVYSVSRCWTDFEFRPPTDEDMAHHWDANFPRITKPLIKITNFPHMGSLFCCLEYFLRCIRRKRMSWLPPQELNTGHGFRLVRSR